MNPIKYLDLFAGIGGFRSGLANAGDLFLPVGYSEIDPYAKRAYEAIYQPKGELYFNDVRTIDPKDLPDIDLICGGFPCQTFSLAGKRAGFSDERGTLFFEIIRIAKVKRPSFLLLENVPGLLSHDGGGTLAEMFRALDELGYDVAWQVLNSADYGVPQSRKRVLLVGFLRERCAGKILSFTDANPKTLIQKRGGSQGDCVYGIEGLSCTLASNVGGFAGKTGLYDVGLPIKSKTKSGFQLAYPGDSIDLAYAEHNTRRGRVGHHIAHTITTSSSQGVYCIDMNPPPNLTDLARCITARQDAGISKRRGEHSGVFEETDAPAAILTAQDRHGVVRNGLVRKLTPRECWWLQGFTDEQFDRAQATGLSDGRLYKMAGNAVSVPVITAVASVIKEVWKETQEETKNAESCTESSDL